ncbi:hypothetical protein [Photobacterium phosphoreum]|jgi:hypothetical protein|uniref:hypothetical protein n=1 Tax=Photobacterium phosphoreum TaxID=659 RepID=UPI0005D3CDA0|nr:hypothetical protein [Photobacterium phosphoreum]KJF86508.1 membrane protein [Photobacterium phosphoreum]MCD9463721.1 hypothetical protein [Photobacterium phosphoreum]MCD9474520.1 hypothetical protein [Photobacterium phosphoreum]MCF2174733.1 hypothetical protein [Photobacterium phosphoreum]PQJ86166.1 hypothetical protein BTO21_15235 [Photobacterium phosphoreum]
MILETLSQSVSTVLHNKKRLLKALLIPFLVTYCLRSMKVSVAGYELYSEILVVIFNIAIFLTSSMICLRTQQILDKHDTDDTVDAPWQWLKFDSQQRRYSGYLLVLFVLLQAIFLLIEADYKIATNGLVYSVMLVLSVVGWVIFSRLSFVLPAIASGKEASFKDAWAITKDKKLYAFVIAGLLPVAFYMLFIGLPIFLLFANPNLAMGLKFIYIFIWGVIVIAIPFIIAAIEATAYRALMDKSKATEISNPA